jgi:hypothetical protein
MGFDLFGVRTLRQTHPALESAVRDFAPEVVFRLYLLFLLALI